MNEKQKSNGGRPKGQPKKLWSVWLPQDLLNQVREYAAARSWTQTTTVEKAIRLFITTQP